MSDVGHNITGLRDAAKVAIGQVQDFKLQRKAINEEIASIRAGMEAKGIKKAGFDMALRYLEWSPEQREGFDLAYALVREAVLLPLEGADLVEMAEASRRAAEAAKPEQDGTE